MPGYIILDVDKEDIPPKYLCSFCGYLLKDARQTPCGHFYCDSCIGSLAINSKLTCLIDGEECLIEQVYPDNFVRREVLSLVVKCPNAEAGCKWRGEVRHLLSHTAECNFQKIKCLNRGCNEKLFQGEMPEHLRTGCKYRTISCSYCGKDVTIADMEKHHSDDCLKFPITCQKCHQEGIPRDKISDHLNPMWGSCSEVEGSCPFSSLGCSTKQVMNKDARSAHLKDKTAFHLSLMHKDYIDFKESLAIQSAVSLTSPLSTSTEEMQNQEIKKLIAIVEGLTQKNVELGKQIAEQQTQLNNMDRRLTIASASNLPSSSFVPSTGKNSNEFQSDIGKIVMTLENRMTQFEVNNVEFNQRMNEQIATLSEIRHQVEEMGHAQASMETRLRAQETTTGITSVTMADMEETVRGLSLVTYDGTLVWKIPDVARRRADAVSGRETSFYSHPFYTKRQGYKMCARIYLNGDGMGRGNSISLFFVIMRGEYDALLRWPFRQKVTMMLLDQDNREHVIDAFRPDPNSSSFQKPRAKMNIASGCPMFCPLTELVSHSYICDDTMFIKVIVDTIDT